MTFPSPEFLSALAAIVMIDIALAGDNAIVIALAARNLPPRLRKRAIAWGTAGAVAVRCVGGVLLYGALKPRSRKALRPSPEAR